MSAPPASTSPSPRYPAPRVMPHAVHALGGIWRLTSRRFFAPGYWLMLAGMLVLLVIFSIPAAPNHAAAADGLIPWAAGFYVCFLLPIFAFISSASAIRDSFDASTVDYIFTRPVRRPAFVVFRYLTQMLCTQIDFAFAFLVIVGIGVYHGVPGLSAALPTLLLGQIMAVIVFTAFGATCATLTSRYVIVGLVYAGVVEVGLGNVPTQINQISLVRQVLGIMRPVIGEEGDPLSRLASISALSQSGIVLLLLVVAAVLVALSALAFALQEFTGAGGRDT